MVWDIRHCWGDYRGQGINSVALASIAWLGVLQLSSLIPFIDILARAIAKLATSSNYYCAARAFKPPSIGSICPVTKEALSEHNHTTVLATS